MYSLQFDNRQVALAGINCWRNRVQVLLNYVTSQSFFPLKSRIQFGYIIRSLKDLVILNRFQLSERIFKKVNKNFYLGFDQVGAEPTHLCTIPNHYGVVVCAVRYTNFKGLGSQGSSLLLAKERDVKEQSKGPILYINCSLQDCAMRFNFKVIFFSIF